jgi:hemoglobin
MSSLYERLGGAPAVDAAVGLFYGRVLADGRLAKFFEGADMATQMNKMKTLLAMVFGGPSAYAGKDMRAAHAHLVKDGLNDAHFDAVLENLKTTLRQLKVGEREIGEVIAIAESVRGEVLGK